VRSSRKQLDPELEALKAYGKHVRAWIDKDEPRRLELLKAQCERFGIALRQLSPHSWRLTLGETWCDYFPRRRTVTHGNERVGDGLAAALEYLGIPKRDAVRLEPRRRGQRVWTTDVDNTAGDSTRDPTLPNVERKAPPA